MVVESKSTYRKVFKIKAGWGSSLRPRPDTYKISGEITYEFGEKTYYRETNIDLSIFSSEGSMLSGTLFGSILGTVARRLTPDSRISETQRNELLLPSIFLNLILAFVAGLILMRKKDVQPFVTIEDFWGGKLLGFLIGYFGIQFFLQMLSGNTSTDTNGSTIADQQSNLSNMVNSSL